MNISIDGKYIVFKGEEEWQRNSYSIKPIKQKKMGKGIEINFSDSSAPSFSYKTMMALSEFFGTIEIDFNDSINSDGCPTCGAGSEYGYLIEVYKITKNYPF